MRRAQSVSRMEQSNINKETTSRIIEVNPTDFSSYLFIPTSTYKKRERRDIKAVHTILIVAKAYTIHGLLEPGKAGQCGLQGPKLYLHHEEKNTGSAPSYKRIPKINKNQWYPRYELILLALPPATSMQRCQTEAAGQQGLRAAEQQGSRPFAGGLLVRAAL